MKKNYNTPIINVVKVKMQNSLMQASLGLKNVEANEAAMSREGRSSWDDEE